MEYIQGSQRDQLVLFSEKLDDIVDENNSVRVIDAIVEKLKLEKLQIKLPSLKTGKPPYHPTLFLKIYIYAYLNKIRSSRKIAAECKKNIELMWLSNQLSPEYWTISQFRKLNKKAMKILFKEFLRFCNTIGLLSFKLVAGDGTKMWAQNSKNNIYKRDKIDEIAEKIDKKIEEYLKELEKNDVEEKSELEFINENIPKKLKQLKKRKEKIAFVKDIFKENPELEKYFSTDEDSRLMRDNGRSIVGFNSQTIVDEKNKLIVSNDVNNEHSDQHQLRHMADELKKTKDELNVKQNSIGVFDAGYFSEDEIMETLNKEDLDLYVPHPKDVKTKEKMGKAKEDKIPNKGFRVEDFLYDEVKDIFVCPNKKELKKRISNGYLYNGIRMYDYVCKECSGCIFREKCTKNKKGRALKVSENINELRAFRRKMNSEKSKKIISKRKEVVEHPFETIKRNLGYRYFMLRGLESVKSEFGFISFIYNFKRVLNMFNTSDLIAKINQYYA